MVGNLFQRNQKIFDKTRLNQQQTTNIATNAFNSWEFTNKTEFDTMGAQINRAFTQHWSNIPTRTSNSKGTYPDQGFFKVNFDGAKDQSGKAGAGFCIRNHEGQLISAGAIKCGSCSIIVAEALGLKAGIRESQARGLQRIIVEGDNLTVTKSTQKVWSIPWEIGVIMEDVDQDLQSFQHVEIKHCFREANAAADFMAKQGLSRHLMFSGINSIPPSFSGLLEKDNLGLAS